jgi:hypothetical protein
MESDLMLLYEYTCVNPRCEMHKASEAIYSLEKEDKHCDNCTYPMRRVIRDEDSIADRASKKGAALRGEPA